MAAPSVCLSPATEPACFTFFTKVSVSATLHPLAACQMAALQDTAMYESVPVCCSFDAWGIAELCQSS